MPNNNKGGNDTNKLQEVKLNEIESALKQKGKCLRDKGHRKVYECEGKVYKYDDPSSQSYWAELLPPSIFLALEGIPYFPKVHGIIISDNKYIGMISEFINGIKAEVSRETLKRWLKIQSILYTKDLVDCDTGPKDLLRVGDKIVKVDMDMIRYVCSVKEKDLQDLLKKGLKDWGFLKQDSIEEVDKIKERNVFNDLLAKLEQ